MNEIRHLGHQSLLFYFYPLPFSSTCSGHPTSNKLSLCFSNIKKITNFCDPYLLTAIHNVHLIFIFSGNFRILASEPHIGGKAKEHELAAYVRDTWRDQGLDDAEFASYNVLLSYPDNNKPNKVTIQESRLYKRPVN